MEREGEREREREREKEGLKAKKKVVAIFFNVEGTFCNDLESEFVHQKKT